MFKSSTTPKQLIISRWWRLSLPSLLFSHRLLPLFHHILVRNCMIELMRLCFWSRAGLRRSGKVLMLWSGVKRAQQTPSLFQVTKMGRSLLLEIVCFFVVGRIMRTLNSNLVSCEQVPSLRLPWTHNPMPSRPSLLSPLEPSPPSSPHLPPWPLRAPTNGSVLMTSVSSPFFSLVTTSSWVFGWDNTEMLLRMMMLISSERLTTPEGKIIHWAELCQ